MNNKVIVSGIRPTGRVHLGNYFGAIKKQIELQKDSDNECFYFIADYHAVNSIKDPAKLQRYIKSTMLDYLALGLDPEKSTLYRQSDIPALTELAFLLSNVVGVGALERMHSYKDKVREGVMPNMGLFYYPILMTADIVGVQADLVPVGHDQMQHIELAQNIARHFNNTYNCNLLKIPTAIKSKNVNIPSTQRIVKDGKRILPKMSKSYGGTIDIFAPEKELRKQIMNIETDSTPINESLDSTKCIVFMLYELMAGETACNELAGKYRTGGYGYGYAKKMLLGTVLDYFKKARNTRVILEKEINERAVLGSHERVAQLVRSTTQDIREICGL